MLDALDGVQDELEHVGEYLHSMFEAALTRARDCYQRWADWSVASVNLDVTVVATPFTLIPPGFGELGVVACVPPREEPEAPAIVKLTFIPGLLGPPSWASVPYLLCHEMICHVNQSAPMSSEDPFGEGWMDLIALQLHDQWAEEIFPWAPSLARSAAARLSDDVLRRWRGLPEPHMTTRGLRYAGREAARWVEEKLVPFHDPSKVPSELIRLSLQLNRASPTVADRMEFISKVNCKSDPRLQAGLLVQLRLWVEDVRKSGQSIVLHLKDNISRVMAGALADVTGVETIKTLVACLGVPDFTVDELARQAGVSRRTVDTVVRRYQHAFDRLPGGKQHGPGRPPVRWRLGTDHLDEVLEAVGSHQSALGAAPAITGS